MYLSVVSRPDITRTTSLLSKFLDKPTSELWKAARHVLRYLKQTKDKVLVYNEQSENMLEGNPDANWASGHRDRKRVNGSAVFYRGNLIS